MTHILLVRHGQTEWNRIRRVQGQTDAQLDETGREQARLVGERLASEEGITAVYASDLSRAMNTAEAIVSHHPDLTITADERMREIGFGPWEGKYWQEFEGHDAELFQQWRNDVTSVTIPGVEPITDFAARVRSFMHDMVAKHPNDKILVAAHGGSINMFITVALEMPLKNCWRMQIGRASCRERV